MAKYLFRLESMHVTNQRGKVPDQDVVTFGLRIGGIDYGPLAPGASQITASSGNTIQFTDHERRDARGFFGQWEVGPVAVGDDDVVEVMYSIVNVSSSDPGHPTPEEVEKLALATWAGLVGVGAAVGGAVGAVVGAVVGAIASIAAVLVDIFGRGTPDCNGVVGGDKVWLTGAELSKRTAADPGTFTITSESGNPDIPSDCGAPSRVEVTLSVTRVSGYSLRQFLTDKLREPQGASGGLKKLLAANWPQLFSGSSTSVIEVIDSWQLVALPPH